MFGRKKKELDLLSYQELWETTEDLSYGDQAAQGVHEFLSDQRIPERARKDASKVALKGVYEERKSYAEQEIMDLEARQERELEELRERQRKERDQAENSITILRERFKMTKA